MQPCVSIVWYREDHPVIGTLKRIPDPRNCDRFMAKVPYRGHRTKNTTYKMHQVSISDVRNTGSSEDI